ncbi:AI-2E family transporter [Georgenia faecalis]|uniref:AI-2E family transporter n=1 Tax=Georgenia faecalis TaxID=2483799 RepID=UPI0019D0A83E|nr:AI-2E family transporter [Georgenia faecalis]
MTDNPPGWLARAAGATRPSRRSAQAPAAVRPLTPRVARRDPGPSADDAVPPSVRSAAAWSWRLLVIAAALVAAGYIVIVFKTVVVSFLVAILLAVLLEPIATRLRRNLRMPRALAAAMTIAVTLAAVGALLALAGRSIVAGFSDLAEQAQVGFTELAAWLSEGPLGIDDAQITLWLEELQTQVEENSGVLVSGVLSATGSVTQVAVGAIIALFCLFFFLREGRRIWQWFVRLAPVRVREPMNEAGIRGWVSLGAYARTQILVAFVDAVGIGAGAAILGVPLALPLAVLVFLGSFIPIVGALFTGSVAVLVALVDQGIGTALIMLGIVLLVQQLEGNVFQPWLMGNAVSLHPVAVLLAVTAGTGIAGILGALFAVPVAAVVNTVVLYLHGHDKYPRLATDWHRPGGPPGIIFGAIRDSYDHVAESASTPDEAGDDAPDAPDVPGESAGETSGGDGRTGRPGDGAPR